MTKIEELISQIKSGDVKCVRLDSICDVIVGGDAPKDCVKGQLRPTIEYPYPIFSNGTEVYGYSKFCKITKPAITISSIGNVGAVFYRQPNFTPIIRLKTFVPKSSDFNLKYLYYYLSVQRFQGTNSSLSSMKAADFKKINVFLPPLSVQQEIIRILDSFTDLQDNLQQELEERKKQYLTYLNLFFDNAQGPEMCLGDVGIMKKGTGIQKVDFVDEGSPCIHYGQIHTYYGTIAIKTKSYVNKSLAKSIAKKNDLIIATTSEDVEACCKAVAWLGDEDVAVSGDAHIFRHNQDPKYMAYLFQSEKFAAQKRMNAVGTKVVRVHGDAMLKFRFLFPPLEEQRRVAFKLEQMEALLLNIKEEYLARQKQYEYYREKLLTF